jgi:hypothetical protein
MKLTIESPRDIETLAKICSTLLEKGKQVVTIQKYEHSRTDAQRRLMWRWNTEISNSLGWMKEEVHDHFKEHLTIPIFIRDNPGFSLMMDSILQVKKDGHLREYLNIKQQVVKLVSTNDYTVKQGAEHLTDMERWAMDKDIVLSHPSDLYYASLGIKRMVKNLHKRPIVQS